MVANQCGSARHPTRSDQCRWGYPPKYYDLVPDPESPVACHLRHLRPPWIIPETSFNGARIIAISQAIAKVPQRRPKRHRPLYLGSDTRAVRQPKKTAIQGARRQRRAVRDRLRDDFGTRRWSHRPSLTRNRTADGTQRFEGRGLADGIVVTPSHSPPTDGGFKITTRHRRPSSAETTNAIAARANRLLGDFKSIKRVPYGEAIRSRYVEGASTSTEHYVDDLENVIGFDVIP